jgi:cyclohexanecarboxyl-CoA dehydrogenase
VIFSFTEQQEAIRDSVARLAANLLAPYYRQREQDGLIERSTALLLGELGCLGGELPEEFGGAGLDYVTSGVIIEEISRGDFNVGYLPLLASLNGHLIAAHAESELAAAWLPDICAGRKICAIALTEPHGGSDAASLRLNPQRRSSDGQVVGTQAFLRYGITMPAGSWPHWLQRGFTLRPTFA